MVRLDNFPTTTLPEEKIIMNTFVYVGVDIAKEKFDAIINLPKGLKHRTFENNKNGFAAFLKWSEQNPKCLWVCMEATGHYSEGLANYLVYQGVQVSVVNPLQIKHFAKTLLMRNKNDRLDAKLILEYCERMQPAKFVPKAEHQKEIRELAQLIDTLKAQLVQLKNQRDSIQTEVGKKGLQKAINALEKQINDLENKLNASAEQNAEFIKNTNLLTTVKGIGVATAYRILAYLPDLNHFDNAKQFAAYIGVTPKQHESGKLKGRTCMTSFGHSRLRKVLYMPALVAKNFNKDLSPFVKRLEKNGLSPKAIVGAVMRKIAHLIFGILKNKQPFDPSLACAPLEQRVLT